SRGGAAPRGGSRPRSTPAPRAAGLRGGRGRARRAGRRADRCAASSRRLRDAAIREAAETLDLGLDQLARGEVDRRLAHRAYARGRAGEDQVAGLERAVARQIRHQLGKAEDNLARATGLPLLAATPARDREIERVAHVVERGEPGPD